MYRLSKFGWSLGCHQYGGGGLSSSASGSLMNGLVALDISSGLPNGSKWNLDCCPVPGQTCTPNVWKLVRIHLMAFCSEILLGNTYMNPLSSPTSFTQFEW